MISVVLCTYNRASILRRMLESFSQQNYLNEIEYELIVVDNNSRDGTRKEVGEYLEHPQCRYIFEERQGLSIARNRGGAEGKGDIVAFLDDDVIVDKDWLKRLQECFEETKADVIGGRTYLIFEKEPPKWLGPEFQIFLSRVDFGDRRLFLSDGFGLWGLNLSFRRSVFETAGGFNENLGRRGSELIAGEDSVLIGKIASQKKRIVYEPGAVVGHIIGPERLEWDYFVKHAIGTGRTSDLSEPKCKASWQVLRESKSVWIYAKSMSKLRAYP